jgi:uncharacterized protein YybS (DUF2232 family)
MKLDASERQPVSPNRELLVLAGLSMLLILLPAFAPLEWLFPTLLGPFPIAILSVKYSWRHVLWLIGLQAGILLVIGALPSMLLLAQYSIVGLALGATMQFGCTASRTISWSVALPLAIGSVVLIVVSAMAQQTPHAYLIAMFQDMADGLYDQLLQMEGLRDEEAMATALEALPRTMVAVLPAVCAVNFLFPNVLNYLLARRYLRHREPPISFVPTDIAQWRATDYLVWVFLGSGIALFLPAPTLNYIGLNVFLVTLAIYFIQGLAIAVFWGRRVPLPSAACWLLAVVAFLLAAPFCVLACTTAGLFDLWVDFRRQRRQLPEA